MDGLEDGGGDELGSSGGGDSSPLGKVSLWGNLPTKMVDFNLELEEAVFLTVFHGLRTFYDIDATIKSVERSYNRNLPQPCLAQRIPCTSPSPPTPLPSSQTAPQTNPHLSPSPPTSSTTTLNPANTPPPHASNPSKSK